jgi:DNA replication and repair protein RecF
VRLTELSVASWRNLNDTVIECDAPLVVVHGDNGQGKSNLLEAVHVLGTLKSFREPRTRRWIRHGEQSTRLAGRVETPMGLRRMVWRWSDGVRRLEMDEANVNELQSWFETIRAIVFCPEDGAIVRGEPERRRRYMDRAAFTAHPGHLSSVTEYRRVLGHKRALLQQNSLDFKLLDAFDVALASHGAAVIFRRVSVIGELRDAFADMHDAIAGQGKVEMKVRVTGLADVAQMNISEIEQTLLGVIQEKRAQEIDRKQVLIGPHRDDLQLSIDGQLARNFASQGQARSIVLGLKLSELDAAQRRGDVPLFLLDDLTSELDSGRRGRLVEVLRTLKGQVWVTTTDPSYLGNLKEVEHLNLHVNNGEITG